jgi:hypothetical protein
VDLGFDVLDISTDLWESGRYEKCTESLRTSVRMKSAADSHGFNWLSEMSAGIYFYSLDSPWR